MKQTELSPELCAEIEEVIAQHVKAALLDMATRLNVPPVYGVCAMANFLIFNSAKHDVAATVDFFRATLDAVEAHGTPAEDEAYQRRDAAFDRLDRAVRLLSDQPEGRA